MRSFLLVLLAALVAAPVATAGDPVPIFGLATVWAPAVVAVPLGTPVVWLATVSGHTVTTAESTADAALQVPNDPDDSDGDPDTFDARLPRGGEPPLGASYTHVFAEPGEYAYYCRLHATLGMVGVVVVR